jgi:DNA-binding MarR family transcriptional regulator
MKRETFPNPSDVTGPAAPQPAPVCRTLLALDQIIEPALRAAALTRLDLDMLLYLYVTEQDGRAACMWDVCQTVSAPFSTAHRHLSAMIDRDFVARVEPRGDWRRVVVGLSPDARQLINAITAKLEHRSVLGRASDGACPTLETGN